MTVISTTIRSDRTRVPAMTAQRSLHDQRITGADSPSIADSSTKGNALDDDTVTRDQPRPPRPRPRRRKRVQRQFFVIPSPRVATTAGRTKRRASACAPPPRLPSQTCEHVTQPPCIPPSCGRAGSRTRISRARTTPFRACVMSEERDRADEAHARSFTRELTDQPDVVIFDGPLTESMASKLSLHVSSQRGDHTQSVMNTVNGQYTGGAGAAGLSNRPRHCAPHTRA